MKPTIINIMENIEDETTILEIEIGSDTDILDVHENIQDTLNQLNEYEQNDFSMAVTNNYSETNMTILTDIPFTEAHLLMEN